MYPHHNGFQLGHGSLQPLEVIYVGSFNLQVTSIPARGTCTGGVKVEPSKVTGVQQMEYVLTTQADRNTPIQTFTANYPNFAHTFTGLPAGEYTVRATEKTGNSQVTSNFNVGNQNAFARCHGPTTTLSVEWLKVR